METPKLYAQKSHVEDFLLDCGGNQILPRLIQGLKRISEIACMVRSRSPIFRTCQCYCTHLSSLVCTFSVSTHSIFALFLSLSYPIKLGHPLYLINALVRRDVIEQRHFHYIIHYINVKGHFHSQIVNSNFAMNSSQRRSFHYNLLQFWRNTKKL